MGHGQRVQRHLTVAGDSEDAHGIVAAHRDGMAATVDGQVLTDNQGVGQGDGIVATFQESCVTSHA